MNDKILSLPVELYNFKEEGDGNISASLKVCYVGETADGRIFDDAFIENYLIPSLPYTPVVGYYDEESEDFIGHNAEQQVFGVVKNDNKPQILHCAEDNKRWLNAEVLLYSSRKDSVGDFAKKIVGKPQSLELGGDTRYEVFNVNGKRKYKFIEGSLIGLSVLGTNEKPAFTGSKFFKENEELEVRFKQFLEYLEKNNRGETNMDKTKYFEFLENFAAKSYSQTQKELNEAVQATFASTEEVSHHFVECNDNSVVYVSFNWNNWSENFFRASYSKNEEGAYTFGDSVEVFRTFITADELSGLDFKKEEEDSKEEDDKCSKCGKEPCECDKEEKDDNLNATENEVAAEVDNTDPVVADPVVTPATETAIQNEETAEQFTAANAKEVANTTSEESNEEAKETKQTEQFATALTESERNELETFRRGEKINLINSFSELPKETLDTFTARVDEFTKEELEAQLSIAFVKFSKNKPADKNKNVSVFSFGAMENTPSNTEDDANLNPYANCAAMFK